MGWPRMVRHNGGRAANAKEDDPRDHDTWTCKEARDIAPRLFMLTQKWSAAATPTAVSAARRHYWPQLMAGALPFSSKQPSALSPSWSTPLLQLTPPSQVPPPQPGTQRKPSSSVAALPAAAFTQT